MHFRREVFHQYIYGNVVTVQSARQPLDFILKKPPAVAPPRLQWMLLRLQKYDLKIVYMPGKDIPVADTRSRKFVSHQDGGDQDIDLHIHTLFVKLPVCDQKMKEITEATSNDNNSF